MLAEKLADAGIKLRSLSVGSYKTLCPQCSHSRRNKHDPCLSVKLDQEGGAVWSCHNCGFKGNVPGERGVYRHREEKKNYRKPAPPKRVENSQADLLKWFAARGITEETVSELGIHASRAWFPELQQERSCIAFPYVLNGEIANVKYRANITRQDGSRGKTFAQEKDARPTLYNADMISPDELIWVEGEMDVAALWEVGFRSVTTLPTGASKASKDNPEKSKEIDPNAKRYIPIKLHAEQLDAVKKVVIATDDDGAGQLLAEQLMGRFGKDRCFTVVWPNGCKDANEVLVKYGRDTLVKMIQDAKPVPIDGAYAASEYFDQVWDIYEGKRAKPLSLGYKELDGLMRVQTGMFLVVSGIPNHGKSSFVDQIAVNMARDYGWRTAFFSPEHEPAEHIIRLVEKVARQNFHDGPNYPRIGAADLDRHLNTVDAHFDFIESKDATPNIDWLLERARWIALRRGLQMLTFDPYNEIEQQRKPGQSETDFVSELISKCKRFAKTYNVLVVMVVHPAKIQKDASGKEPPPTLYDLHGSAHWRNKADLAFVIHRDFDFDETLFITRKVRNQPIFGQIGQTKFRFNMETRCYDPIDPAPTAPTHYTDRDSTGPGYDDQDH